MKKHIYILLLVALFFMLTCTEQPTEPARDNPLDEENPQTGGDPFNLTAQIAGGGIQLNWQSVNIEGIIGYNIHRSVDDSSFSLYYEISGRNTVSFVDTLIQNGHEYSYYIVTCNEQGQESTSNTAEVDILMDPLLQIDDNIGYTPTRQVNLTLLAFGAVSMIVGIPDLSMADWENYSTTKSIELTSGIDEKVVMGRFVYSDGDTSELVSDTTRPKSLNPSVEIEQGVNYIDTSDATLSMSDVGAVEMKLNTQNDSSSVPWQNFVEQYDNFDLGSGDGLKYTYAWFKNDFFIDGPAVDSIWVDTSCEIDTFYWTTNSNDTLEAGDSIQILLYMEDDLIGSEENGNATARIGNYYTDISLVEQGDGLYSENYIIQNYSTQLSESFIITNLVTSFVDRAGNSLSDQSASDSLTIILKAERCFGGIAEDQGKFIEQTSDGGYIVVGYTNSFGAGAKDVYLVKTDGSGNELWYRTFGGSDDDYGNCVKQTTDMGYIIVGWTSSFYSSTGGGLSNVYLIKTDDSGNEIWSHVIGGGGYEYGYSVQQTSDGGFIVAGSNSTEGSGSFDVYLIKTDANGSQQWTKTYGGSSYEHGYSVQPTSDNGYIIVGSTHSYGAGYDDVYLVKTDASGNQQWDRAYGGIYDDYGQDVKQTIDNGYIITGRTTSFDDKVYLIKTNSSGNEEWEKTLGEGSYNSGESVLQTTDGGYIIAGYSYLQVSGYQYSEDVCLLKTNANGDEQWNKIFGGNYSDSGYCVQQTSDSQYVISGSTNSYGAGSSDVYLIKTGPNP